MVGPQKTMNLFKSINVFRLHQKTKVLKTTLFPRKSLAFALQFFMQLLDSESTATVLVISADMLLIVFVAMLYCTIDLLCIYVSFSLWSEF